MLRLCHSQEDEWILPKESWYTTTSLNQTVTFLVIWIASVPTLSPNYQWLLLLPGSPQFSVELIAEATQNMTTSRESFKKL